MKVIKVVITMLKGERKGKTETWYAFTPDQSLSALELRELVHGHWRIENNGFKELSKQCGSKHR
jgi:hypothetical protein